MKIGICELKAAKIENIPTGVMTNKSFCTFDGSGKKRKFD